MDEPIITFIYASQTGNCEEISLDMYTTAQEKGYKAERYEFDEHLESFDLTSNEPKRIVVIFWSSTGDGECPDNGNKFYRYLSKSAKIAKEQGDSAKIFRHLRYTILGLGDSDYSSLHKWPKTVNSWFEALGARSFHYFGLADEATGLEIEIEPWKKYFWKELPKTIEEVKSETDILFRKDTIMKDTEEKVIAEIVKEEAEEKPILKARISNTIIESEKYRTVLRLEMEVEREIKESDNVEAGSYISILPLNYLKVVNEFIECCHWEPTEELINSLTRDLDFLKPVHSKALSMVVDDPENDLYLKETAEYSYYDLVKFIKPKKPVDKAILEFIPSMKARYYSLSSDLSDTNKLEIWFTWEDYIQNNALAKDYSIEKKGVCSHFLKRLSEDSKCEFELKLNKSSMFHTTKEELKSKSPMIFLAHGTAIAPFISVLNYFKRQLESCEIDFLGNIEIYFGIRNKLHDYLYEKELNELMSYFKEKHPDGKYNIHLAESRPGKIFG
jgi:sulfite reductase alpha subunit-like flavoprotein